MNFLWVIFRNPIDLNKIHDFQKFCQPLFQTWKNLFRKIQPKYTYYEYQEIYEVEKNKAIELGIALQRIEGNVCLKQPLLRFFIGLDNIIIYRQRVNSINYPLLNHHADFDSIFEKTKEIVLQFFQHSWNFLPLQHFVEISGQHSCLLNCGRCCDGADFTRSPLLGGRYCKAITTVGDLCIYRLFNPPYPPEDPVCGEYFCGSCQSSVDVENEGSGCSLFAFTPLFDSANREEFFDLFGKVCRNEDLIQIVGFQSRAGEVEQYCILTRLIEELLKPIQNLLPIFTETFLFALGRHYIDNCESLLIKYKEQLGTNYERLVEALDGYSYWHKRYQDRRRRVSKPIVPKEFLKC